MVRLFGLQLGPVFNRLLASSKSWLAVIGTWPSVAMFRNSRVLVVATLILSSVVLAPLFVTPFLPLVDLGSNVGAAMLLDDAAFSDGLIANHYAVNSGPVPYWTGYLALALLEPLFGALWATKVFIGFLVVLLPIATMRLLVALGRSPLLGLWAFMLSWDLNLFWGWFTFQFGMALALWALAWLVEMKTYREALRLGALGVFIALTHVHAVAFACVAGGLVTLVKRPLPRSLLQGTVALIGFLAPQALWFLTATRPAIEGAPAPGFAVNFHPLAHKVANLHNYALDVIPEAQWQSVTALLLLLFAPALFSWLPVRSIAPEKRHAAVAIVAGALLLYLALPYELFSPIAHFWTYPRFASYVLLTLLLVPAPDFSRWRLVALTPGIIVAVLMGSTIKNQFADYGNYVSPYLSIIESIESQSRLLPLDLDDFRYKGTRMPSIGQLHGYAAAVTSSYDGHLFENPSNPLLFRGKHILPHPAWHQPHTFNMQAHGRYYDFIIVHPTERDPFVRRRHEAKQVTLVKEAGPWRLYRVNERTPYP